MIFISLHLESVGFRWISLANIMEKQLDKKLENRGYIAYF